MERLTERDLSGEVLVHGCGNNCKYAYAYCNSSSEDCPTIDEIIEKLAKYEDSGLEPEEVESLKNSSSLEVDREVYVVTRYSKTSGYEVIKCRIKRKTIKTRKTITVKGRYSNGNPYHSNFVENSLGKTIFLSEEEAKEMCERLNKIR